MKNSAVKNMIANQFNWVELSDINVVFEWSQGSLEHYRVTLCDEGEFREFGLNIEFVEIV